MQEKTPTKLTAALIHRLRGNLYVGGTWRELSLTAEHLRRIFTRQSEVLTSRFRREGMHRDCENLAL